MAAQPLSSAARARSTRTRGSASAPNGGMYRACSTPLQHTPRDARLRRAPMQIGGLPLEDGQGIILFEIDEDDELGPQRVSNEDKVVETFFGVYDINANEGFVVVGDDHD